MPAKLRRERGLAPKQLIALGSESGTDRIHAAEDLGGLRKHEPELWVRACVVDHAGQKISVARFLQADRCAGYGRLPDAMRGTLMV